LQRDTGADFGQRGSLLVDTHIYAALNEGIGRRHPADATADDGDTKCALFHVTARP